MLWLSDSDEQGKKNKMVKEEREKQDTFFKVYQDFHVTCFHCFSQTIIRDLRIHVYYILKTHFMRSTYAHSKFDTVMTHPQPLQLCALYLNYLVLNSILGDKFGRMIYFSK